MGQILRIISVDDYDQDHRHPCNGSSQLTDECIDNVAVAGLPDLECWPPELSLAVLKNLNPTDLCLAACVWRELARDQILWQSLCYAHWGYATVYVRPKPDNWSYHKLYLQLDEGTVTFNADAEMGMDYFFRHHLVDNQPAEVAKFFHLSPLLDRRQMRLFLNNHPETLDQLVKLQNFENQFLAKALRRFFLIVQAPNEHDQYLHLVLDKFSRRFVECNPKLGLSPDMVYILCFSLIMLSVDLTSPHVKNKMSKREFIRNVRHAIHRMDDEFFGHLYDDIYLKGHIAPNTID